MNSRFSFFSFIFLGVVASSLPLLFNSFPLCSVRKRVNWEAVAWIRAILYFFLLSTIMSMKANFSRSDRPSSPPLPIAHEVSS